jgi:hypothetical protein
MPLIVTIKHHSSLNKWRRISLMYNKKESIFKKDKEGNYFYYIWRGLGKGYIVNDSEKRKVLEALEDYRYLILSYKPPIIIPIIIFSMIIAIGLIFIGKFKIDIQAFVIEMTFILYLLSVLLYLGKIYKILYKCERMDYI